MIRPALYSLELAWWRRNLRARYWFFWSAGAFGASIPIIAVALSAGDRREEMLPYYAGAFAAGYLLVAFGIALAVARRVDNWPKSAEGSL